MQFSPNLPPSTLAGKKILIAGAGIAGLAFNLSLRKIWKEDLGKFPEVIHYEREAEQPEVGRDGYSIGISSGKSSAGLQVLQKLKVLNTLLDISIARTGNERYFFGLWSLDWRRLARLRDKARENLPISAMRIARSKIRNVLLEAATEQGQITWGVACTEILPPLDARIRVQLSNGEMDCCDFLVVADGANSTLRASIRPDDKLNFAGPVSISAVSHFPGQIPEPVNREWGIVPSGQGAALFISPMDKQSVNWSLSYIAEAPCEQLRQPLPAKLNAQLLQEAKERGAIFKEPFPTLLERSDAVTIMVLNAMDKKPFAHGAATGLPKGIAFIGDSNHAVSPFSGNGANLALMDGYDLAECLCAYQTVETAVEVYDKRSIPRASASIRTSHFCIALVHSSGLLWIVYHTLLLISGGILSIWRPKVGSAWILKRG